MLPVVLEQPPAELLPAKHGKIGLGTWLTQAEYKDIRVAHGSQVLFQSDFSQNANDWQPQRGTWQVKDGAYQQTAEGDNVQSWAGDPAWTDYTYHVKARKLGGAEGFLIMFHVQDANNWLWWNIGGWGNHQHAIEQCENGGKSLLGQAVPGEITTGRWYDIRIELNGHNIKCYLDNQLIHDVKATSLKPLYATASLVKATGETIVKVVNASRNPHETQMQLTGIKSVRPQAQTILLTSANGTDENSLSEPTKVRPVSQPLDIKSPTFTYAFPPNSVTIFRLKCDAN